MDQIEKVIQTSEDTGVLKHTAQKLDKLLSDNFNMGILVIFYDKGWLHSLNTVGMDFNPIKLQQEFDEIKYLQEEVIMKEHIHLPQL